MTVSMISRGADEGEPDRDAGGHAASRSGTPVTSPDAARAVAPATAIIGGRIRAVARRPLGQISAHRDAHPGSSGVVGVGRSRTAGHTRLLPQVLRHHEDAVKIERPATADTAVTPHLLGQSRATPASPRQPVWSRSRDRGR
jgi:hypothetical protein